MTATTKPSTDVHVHFDLVGGIAGDMTVAALVDAGASFDAISAALASSGLPVVDVSVTREWKGGMAGTQFHVPEETDPPHRTWKMIRAMLEEATLPTRARDLAIAMFQELAIAEGTTHGCAPDDVHFHEIGAMDSIVDFVAVALAVDDLGATSFSCGAIPICPGTTHTQHGVMPLPTPATAHLLAGFSLVTIPGTLETVTPTGAAILRTLCGPGGAPMPDMTLRAVGTGLGNALLEDRPNVLRVLVAERAAQVSSLDVERGTAVVIEATIDDMDPRLYASIAERLFVQGALDVALSAVQMKKHRPGTVVTVVARPHDEDTLTAVLLRESTTLGVRSWTVRRAELAREHREVATRFGIVRIKLGRLGGEIVNRAPEYDDCATRAREHDVPVKDVLAAAIAAAESLRAD